jgi:hypothetical protein
MVFDLTLKAKSVSMKCKINGTRKERNSVLLYSEKVKGCESGRPVAKTYFTYILAYLLTCQTGKILLSYC